MQNLKWHSHKVARREREALLGQKGCVIFLTGISGSGKSSIANEASRMLFDEGRLSYVLDGDNIRCGLNCDLGFSKEDRRENIRRASEVAALFADAGVIVFAAFICPYKSMRESARKRIGKGYIEAYVRCGMKEAERRDPKGLYRRARGGLIRDFTGVDAPYEEPESPDIELDSEKEGVCPNAERVLALLKERGYA